MLHDDCCTSDEKWFLKIENKRILLQPTSFNFQKKTNFMKITLLTVAWTKLIIVESCWQEHFKDIYILSTLPPFNFLWFSNIPLLNVGQYVFSAKFSCIQFSFKAGPLR